MRYKEKIVFDEESDAHEANVFTSFEMLDTSVNIFKLHFFYRYSYVQTWEPLNTFFHLTTSH